MLREAYKVWRAYAELPTLWHGWDHASTPVACYTDDEAVLFAHPNPPADFQPITIGEHVAHVSRPKPRTFTANTNVDVNGVQTATIMWADCSFASALSLTAHEAFHAYQQTNGFPTANIMLMSNYPVYDPLVNALGEVEAKLLRQAIIADDMEAARQALDARAARQQLLSPELRGYEDGNEYNEGLAVYVELQAQEQGGPNRQLWLDDLATANQNGKGADRARFYGSGMAYGLLLDRYYPDWQTAIMRDWPALSTALAKAVYYTPDPNCRDFKGMDFPLVLAQQEKDATARRQEMESRMAEAFPGTGVRVDATFQGVPVAGGWHPFMVKVVPGHGRFHPTMFSYIYDQGGEFKVERGGLEPEMIKRVVFERDDLQVTVDGQQFTGGNAQGLLEIKGSDSYLKMPDAEITWEGNTLKARQMSQ